MFGKYICSIHTHDANYCRGEKLYPTLQNTAGWSNTQIDRKKINKRKEPNLLCIYIQGFHKTMEPRANQAVEFICHLKLRRKKRLVFRVSKVRKVVYMEIENQTLDNQMVAGSFLTTGHKKNFDSRGLVRLLPVCHKLVHIK